MRVAILIIGLLTLFAAIYALANGASFVEQLLGIVAGVTLIYCFFLLRKPDPPKT